MTASHEHSALLEAAERFDGLARAIKDNQLAATGARCIVPDAPAVLHPEEDWARRFATRTIRPAPGGGPPLSGLAAPSAEGPEPPVFAESTRPAARPEGAAGGHIGSGLGKPAPRRSWLARVLKGG